MTNPNMTIEKQCETSEKKKSMLSTLNRHPWIYVVVAFSVLIAAWATLIAIAIKNRPEPLPVQNAGVETVVRSPSDIE